MFTFVQNFIKLNAAVNELSCSQSFDDAANNTAVASAGSNNKIIINNNDNDTNTCRRAMPIQY